MKRAVLFATLMLLGCGKGVLLEERLYLLRGDTSSTMSRGASKSAEWDTPDVALGQVVVAPYLAQSGIVVETGPGELRPARYHRWAEPLEDGVRSVLRDGIARASGRAVAERVADAIDPVRIDASIEVLHVSLEGAATLRASWVLVQPGADRSAETHRFSSTRRLAADGYPGAVEAEEALLQDWAAAIAASLPPLDAAVPEVIP